MNIVVLAGGWSPERDVSLSSGSRIANALISRGHRVLLLDPYLGMEWTGDPLLYFRSDPVAAFTVGESLPDLATLQNSHCDSSAKIAKTVLPLCQAADVVYIGLHGDIGENGTLQALLDCYGIRYTGSGAVGSMLAMDKALTKQMLSAAAIATPHGIVLSVKTESLSSMRARVLQEVGLPCVIKPCSCGSSVGVSIVNSVDELDEALQDALVFEDRLLVEQRIVGRELTAGVLDGYRLPPMEIVPREGFYDYKNKYQNGCTLELCPAPIPQEKEQELQELTARGFEALRLSGYARFDYIMDGDGKLWCLEANTLPGMTPTSLLPQMAGEIGLDYATLCDTIVQLAYHKKK